MRGLIVKASFWGSIVAITVASLLPVAMLPSQSLDVWDKAQHAFGFAWLALLALAAYPSAPVKKCMYLLAYGGAIEIAQAATGWRYGEWADIAADGIGIAIGVVAWSIARRATAA